MVRRPFAARRRVRRSRTPGAKTAPQQPVTFDRILALPAVDRVLGRLLSYPRILQWTGVLVGLLLAILAVYPLVFPAPLPAAPALPQVAASAAQTLPSLPADQVVLAVVAAYNQASITAAVLNKADPMTRYLAPDGQAWAEVQVEYQRRITKGETHDPMMSRWGVLKIAVDGATAMVETQEQWDDLTSISGTVVSSKRGIVTRNIYTLRRSPNLGGWLIMTVTSTLVIG